MVLISIHPFALRRIFLVLLALVGFSALCFADPVLMAHRYTVEKSPSLVRTPGTLQVEKAPQRATDSRSTHLIPSTWTTDVSLTLDSPALPSSPFESAISQNWAGDLRIAALPATDNNTFLLNSTATD